MAGTLIAQFTSSNAAVHTNYFDPLINQNTNFLALDIRKTGIYSGGYLTPVGNTAVTLSNLSCEIQDSGGSGNQVRLVTTGSSISVPVSSTSPALMVVLRWTYTTSTSANYPSIYTVQSGSQNATDLIVGTAIYSGPTLSVDYGLSAPLFRSDPNVYDLQLKVEPVTTLPYAMTSGVIVRTGKANYGIKTFIIPTQVVGVSASIGTPNYYQNVPLQIATNGTFASLTTGTATAGSTPTAPVYGNLITIAEITVQYTGGGYYITAIKDVRCFVNSVSTITLNSLLPSQTGNGGKSLITDGANANWDNATYA